MDEWTIREAMDLLRGLRPDERIELFGSRDPGSDIPRYRGWVMRRRNREALCGWCGKPISVQVKGPIATYCGGGCRIKHWRATRGNTCNEKTNGVG